MGASGGEGGLVDVGEVEAEVGKVEVGEMEMGEVEVDEVEHSNEGGVLGDFEDGQKVEVVGVVGGVGYNGAGACFGSAAMGDGDEVRESQRKEKCVRDGENVLR